MRDAAIEAIDFVSGRSRDELNTNRMLTLALVKDIEIIGEAALVEFRLNVERDIHSFLGDKSLECGIG
jgi:uncharacterized protein with HEPN domain